MHNYITSRSIQTTHRGLLEGTGDSGLGRSGLIGGHLLCLDRGWHLGGTISTAETSGRNFAGHRSSDGGDRKGEANEVQTDALHGEFDSWRGRENEAVGKRGSVLCACGRQAQMLLSICCGQNDKSAKVVEVRNIRLVWAHVDVVEHGSSVSWTRKHARPKKQARTK